MKKISLLTLLLSSFLFISCSKIEFTLETPKKDAALVYIYALESTQTNASDVEDIYKVLINGKNTEGTVKELEYKTYDFKAGNVTFSSVRNDLEKNTLTLNIEAGKTYYLRIQGYGDAFGEFEFQSVDAQSALIELKSTTVAGKYDTSNNMLTELIDPNKHAPKAVNSKGEESNIIRTPSIQPTIQNTVNTSSKLDDIKEAYEMKKQGLLTNEEFKTMKAEILSK